MLISKGLTLTGFVLCNSTLTLGVGVDDKYLMVTIKCIQGSLSFQLRGDWFLHVWYQWPLSLSISYIPPYMTSELEFLFHWQLAAPLEFEHVLTLFCVGQLTWLQIFDNIDLDRCTIKNVPIIISHFTILMSVEL